MPSKRPTKNVLTAALAAALRIRAEIATKSGIDAKRAKRALGSIENMIARLFDGGLGCPQNKPRSLLENPSLSYERKVTEFWGATEHLMDWMFNPRTIRKEPDIIAAFDAIA